jgi:hypothetical protein
MFGFFANRYAPPMTLEEVAGMIKELGRSSGARFCHSAVSGVYEAVGGHPFLVRKYCSLLLKGRTRPVEIDQGDVTAAEEAFLRQETSHFAEMVSVVKELYPAEFRVLHEIATKGGLHVESVNRRILAHLEGYQLVEIEGGEIRMRYRLMQNWLQGVTGRVAAEVSRPLVAFAVGDDGGGPSTIDDDLVTETIREVELSLRETIRRILERRWAGKADQRIAAAIGKEGIEAAQERLGKSLRFRQESDGPAHSHFEHGF